MRAAPPSWEQRLTAATLWVGAGAAVSGGSAAAFWRFPDFPPSATVEVSHEGARRSRPGVVVRRVTLPPEDVVWARGLPVTTPARTLSDVAGMTTQRRLDAALHHCLHERLATRHAIGDVLQRRSGPGFAGAGRLREALAAYAEGAAAASPLEARLARRLSGSTLPRPVRQHEVHTAGRRLVLDFAWPQKRVAVEVDGYRWHSSRAAWQRDRERLSALRRAGWTVVNVTREDVDERFDELAEELRPLLR